MVFSFSARATCYNCILHMYLCIIIIYNCIFKKTTVCPIRDRNYMRYNCIHKYLSIFFTQTKSSIVKNTKRYVTQVHTKCICFSIAIPLAKDHRIWNYNNIYFLSLESFAQTNCFHFQPPFTKVILFLNFLNC